MRAAGSNTVAVKRAIPIEQSRIAAPTVGELVCEAVVKGKWIVAADADCCVAGVLAKNPSIWR
jgi:hypothetical protein